MRRGREKDLEKYVNVRIAQLKQDMEKAHDDYDKQWYNRIIQELCWVKSQQHNCYLDEVQHWKDNYSYLPQTRKRMRTQMPYGKGTYGKKRGRPSKAAKKRGKKKMGKKGGLTAKQKKLPPALRAAILKKKKRGKK